MTIEEAINVLQNKVTWDDGYDATQVKKACNLAVSALRAQQEQLNEPLTLEELREMDGEPMWCVDSDGTVPGLVCMYEGLADVKKEPHIWIPDNEGFVKMYSIRHMLDSGAKFYRRKPEQED